MTEIEHRPEEEEFGAATSPGHSANGDYGASQRPRHGSGDRPITEFFGYGDVAVDYLDRLGPVVPLPRAKKHPPPKGFTGRGGRAPTRDEIEAWRWRFGGGNVAFPLLLGMAGIDVDDYGDKHGAATLAEAERRWGKLPPTVRSQNRSDGVSGIKLFRIPPGVVLHGKVEFPELHLGGIDVIQHHHRYVVVWPSIHPSGRLYVWFDERIDIVLTGPPRLKDLPELPAAWVEALRAEAPGKRTSGQSRIRSSDIARYDVSEAITGGQPSWAVLTCLALALRDLGWRP